MTPVAVTGRRPASRASFEQFVGEHGDRLLHTAYGLCGDWQHAEDLVQGALVRVARHWDRIGDNPAGYAYRCLVRANIDRWRVRRHRPEVLADPRTVSGLQPGTTGEDTARRVGIAAVLATLPPRRRAIVVLRFLQDLSESETAAVLGISVGAVKSGAARALATLRDTPAMEEL